MRFDDLCYKTVARVYRTDDLTAGIVISKLRDCYYAAIVRYPNGNDGSKVVECHGYSRYSSQHALAMLMLSWTHKCGRIALVRKFATIAQKHLHEAQAKAEA